MIYFILGQNPVNKNNSEKMERLVLQFINQNLHSVGEHHVALDPPLNMRPHGRSTENSTSEISQVAAVRVHPAQRYGVIRRESR